MGSGSSVNPANDEIIAIEINPRVSRSSALASKATGYPIAKIASKLAIGYNLDELKNPITGTTSAFFEPTLKLHQIDAVLPTMGGQTALNLAIDCDKAGLG